MSPRVHPCVWLDHQASAAAELYGRAFGAVASPAVGVTRRVEVLGMPLTLLDGGPHFRPNPSISMFARLADGAARPPTCRSPGSRSTAVR